MENHFDKRLDPAVLVPGAKSVVSLMYNYFPHEQESESNHYHVAKYAYGHDYHHVIRDKLKQLMASLTREIGEINGRVFVDSGPVMERQWAALSGLGWLGKNALLINKQRGSFFFLAEIIIDVEFEYDAPIKDYCGTCTRCIDACPTDALLDGRILDANKCISYLTIELRDEISEGFEGKFKNWVFGCDICQDVCPWNRFSAPHNEPLFEKNPGVKALTNEGRTEFSLDEFNEMFRHSPIKRTRHAGLSRNIKFVKNLPTKESS